MSRLAGMAARTGKEEGKHWCQKTLASFISISDGHLRALGFYCGFYTGGG